MIKALIAYSIGHESGHIIDALWRDGENIKPKLSSADTSDNLLDDFPVNYNTKEEPWKSLYKEMVYERFAGFFAIDLARGLGRNMNAIFDYNTNSLPVHPEVLMAAVVKLNSILFEDERSEMSGIVDYLYFNLIAGSTALAGAIPFDKKTVEKIIAGSVSGLVE